MSPIKDFLVMVKEVDGSIYLSLAKIIPIKVIDDNIYRECLFEKCHKETKKYSSYCWLHWYDITYNSKKVKFENGKIYSLKKKKKLI